MKTTTLKGILKNCESTCLIKGYWLSMDVEASMKRFCTTFVCLLSVQRFCTITVPTSV
jgi:hypothetical protein